MNNFIIETPRLLLGGWEENDFNIFTTMNADSEVMRYFPETYSHDLTKHLYNDIQKEFSEFGYGLYAVREKSTYRFIGFIGFHNANFESNFCPCIEIGWRLHKLFWNKGYATEGAKACLQYGFDKLNFDRIYSFTSVQNIPSQRVMQKIEMQKYGNFDHPKVPENHPLRPHICYVIDKKDWKGQSKKISKSYIEDVHICK